MSRVSCLTSFLSFFISDLSDVPENLPLPAPGSESPQALNYSQIASAAVAVSQGGQDPSVSSTETLLRNIQGLLEVAADNARRQERKINHEKGQWQGFLKTLEGALHNFIIFQLSQNHIRRHWFYLWVYKSTQRLESATLARSQFSSLLQYQHFDE